MLGLVQAVHHARPGDPIPASPLSLVPVKALDLSCPEQLPLPLEGQALQPLPGRIHLVLLCLDQLLLRVLLLGQEGQTLRPAPVAPSLLTWPWLPDMSASAILTVLKNHWLFVWNGGKLLPRELHFLFYKKARALVCAQEPCGASPEQFWTSVAAPALTSCSGACLGASRTTARPKFRVSAVIRLPRSTPAQKHGFQICS